MKPWNRIEFNNYYSYYFTMWNHAQNGKIMNGCSVFIHYSGESNDEIIQRLMAVN